MPEIGSVGRADNFIGTEGGQHVQRDWLDGWSRVSAVATLASDAGRNLERIEIHSDDGVECVDQR